MPYSRSTLDFIPRSTTTNQLPTNSNNEYSYHRRYLYPRLYVSELINDAKKDNYSDKNTRK